MASNLVAMASSRIIRKLMPNALRASSWKAPLLLVKAAIEVALGRPFANLFTLRAD